MKTVSILGVCLAFTAAAFGQIVFPDGSTATTGDLTNVTVVQAGGSATANGTALKAAMNAISGVNASPIVLQLAAGTYHLGTDTLTMRPFVHLRGVGKQASIITGSGGPGVGFLVHGDDETFVSELTLHSTEGAILFAVTGGNASALTNVLLALDTTGGVSAIAASVRSGAHLDLFQCIFAGDTVNTGGSRLAIQVTSTDSECFSFGSFVDMIELSGTGTVAAVETSFGGSFEAHGGEFLVRRDTAGSDATAVDVATNSQAVFFNTRIESTVDVGDGTAVSNSGGFRAFSTYFQGAIPNPLGEFFVSETDRLFYSQCSQGFLDI